MAPSLGIWLPTWNRARFFNRLIRQIEEQRQANVTIKVGLEPGSDGYDIPKWCEVIHNPTRLGCTRNVMQGLTALDTDYLWTIGDDEQLREGAIAEVVDRIAARPGMVICTDGVFDHGPTGDYPTWVAWMDDCLAHGREVMLTAQTLTTSTVFRREALNVQVALDREASRYGFHFGILEGLMFEPVSVTRRPVFISGHWRDSSIFAETADYLASHAPVTQATLRELVDFASHKAGRNYPASCYVPGVGFDSGVVVDR